MSRQGDGGCLDHRSRSTGKAGGIGGNGPYRLQVLALRVLSF
jgi:hypothetical protein